MWTPFELSELDSRLGAVLGQWVKSEFESYTGAPVLMSYQAQGYVRSADGELRVFTHDQFLNGRLHSGSPQILTNPECRTAEDAARSLLQSLCGIWDEAKLTSGEKNFTLVWRIIPEIMSSFGPLARWRSYVRLSIVPHGDDEEVLTRHPNEQIQHPAVPAAGC